MSNYEVGYGTAQGLTVPEWQVGKQAEAREELARTGKTGIFVYDRTLWQIKPAGTYGEKRFSLFLGDSPRHEPVDAGHDGAQPSLVAGADHFGSARVRAAR